MKSTELRSLSEVIAFPKQRMFTIPLHKLDSFEGIKIISRMMREWQKVDKKKRTWNKMSTMTGLSHTTISNLASHTTKAPRLHTLLAVMGALGFKMVRFE